MVLERAKYPNLCRVIASWHSHSSVAESYSVDDPADPSHLDLAEAAVAPYATWHEALAADSGQSEWLSYAVRLTAS